MNGDEKKTSGSNHKRTIYIKFLICVLIFHDYRVKKMEFLIFGFIICLISTFIALRLIPARRNPNLPPGPRPLPIIGNLLDLGDNPHQSLAKLAESYGPIMSLKLGQVTAVVVSSPETIQQVLQTHDHFLSFRAVPDALSPYDHGQLAFPWIPVSPTYKNIRKICNTHLLSPKTLDANQNLRRTRIDDLLANIRRSALNGEAVDIGEAVFTTTLNLISYSIWSVDLADPNSEMAKQFKVTMRGLMEEAGKPNISDFFPVLKRLDMQGIRRRITVHFGKMFEMIDGKIDERLKMQELPDFSPKNDMLHHLLNMREDNNEIPLDRNQIKHSILVLFTGGTETTTSIVQWAMTHLLKNPETMVKLKEELSRVIGKGNPVEESHINKLPYLQAVIKETLRLQSALLLPRKAESEVAISGFTIPKGTQIIVNLWASYRDSSVWESPYLFLPERFLDSASDSKARNFEFIPFGSGRRICPGQPLATRMLHLMVGSLLHWFDWKLEEGVTPENMNMDENFGITVEKAQPLRAVPLLT
ncbi:geraniol 8-hydroxylase-like [Cucurbita pepo subsp. pepo]|uniref:geraniol 8-hydroxylase-like n=2 Tax=Cucurbita pepo subsp. pepo TaxID=3664 RepID=UPI000C9D595D|nr:geraniol 8-hydroxylase-like [Cucurbita pepo subsp. pepo]